MFSRRITTFVAAGAAAVAIGIGGPAVVSSIYNGLTGTANAAVGLILMGQVLSRFVRHRLLVLNATPSKENLAALRELAESGKVVPVIDRTYPLSEAADAIRYLEVEHARAKVLITVCRRSART